MFLKLVVLKHFNVKDFKYISMVIIKIDWHYSNCNEKTLGAWILYNSVHVCFLSAQEITFPKMVANCCRFLCYFCRISRQNQKAMFDHLSYLLENSSVGLGDLLLLLLFICSCVNKKKQCAVYWWDFGNFVKLHLFLQLCPSLLTEKCLHSATQIHLCCFIDNRLPALLILPLLFIPLLSFLPSPASPSMRGSTPLDVAAASVMDNNELALALREPDLEKVRLTFVHTQRGFIWRMQHTKGHLRGPRVAEDSSSDGKTNALSYINPVNELIRTFERLGAANRLFYFLIN